jgi:hypothetical protein
MPERPSGTGTSLFTDIELAPRWSTVKLRTIAADGTTVEARHPWPVARRRT